MFNLINFKIKNSFDTKYQNDHCGTLQTIKEVTKFFGASGVVSNFA